MSTDSSNWMQICVQIFSTHQSNKGIILIWVLNWLFLVCIPGNIVTVYVRLGQRFGCLTDEAASPSPYAMHNPNYNEIVYDKNEIQDRDGFEYTYNNNKDGNLSFFWDQFATNLLQDMDPAEDIKEDVLIAKVNEFMKNNFYNKKLEESIKHNIEFIQQGEKYVTCLN